MDRSTSVFSLCLLVVLALVLPASGAMAQTLVYEREFSLLAEADNTLRITLSADDRIVIERPAFMTWPGHYESNAAAGSHARLSRQLAGLLPLTRQLGAEINQRARNEMVYVSDPEYTRFMLLDSQRQLIDAVEMPSLQAWSANFPDDVRLRLLQDLESQWTALMDDVLAGEQP